MIAPQIGETVKIYKPGMVGGGYETVVISAAFNNLDDARGAGFTEDSGYPEPGECENWIVLSTCTPFGRISEYAVVTA